MARSSRIAGGCSAPTEGNRRVGQSRLTTAIFACRSSTAPCGPCPSLAPEADQCQRRRRPDACVAAATRRRRPARAATAVRLDAACRRRSGRRTAMLPSSYPSSRATCWNQATSGRRQIDARAEHQREMHVHRHVGGLRRRDGAARLAERDLRSAAGTARRSRSGARTPAEWRAAARARRSSSRSGTRS